MPFISPKSLCFRRDRPGFALVITLSLMILITVIAVGMLTLASISLRSTSHTSAMAQARANARLALALAIGELQANAGPDTRVTARADLIKEGNPPVLGVWKSWEGEDHDRDGRPVAPDYSDHKKARFLAWLTSSSRDAGMDAVPATDKGVPLLGAGSVGTKNPSKRQVRLTPVAVSTRGGMAWWVGGENQKARLPRSYEPEKQTAAGWSDLMASHAVADPKPFGLDSLLDHPESADLAVSLRQADLLKSGGGLSKEFYHDLTTDSVGLLTNTATGGWRKDLSLASESWSSFSTRNLPLFRATPQKDITYTRPTSGNPLAADSLLYPWSDYRRGATANVAIYSFPPIGSWENLMDYATLYKDFNATSGVMSTVPRGTRINGDVFSFIHKVRVLPVIARVQWIFSHLARPSPTLRGKYDLYVVVQPVFTMWNPYNVRLTSVPGLGFGLVGYLPPVIDYKVGGVPVPKKYMFSGTSYNLSRVPDFAPGETRVFSTAGNGTELTTGYTPGKGTEIEIAKGVGLTPGNEKITTDIRFDAEYDDAGAVGVGMYLNMNTSSAGGAVLAYRMIYDRSVANVSYPPRAASEFPNPTLAEAAVPTPFLSVTFGARMASNTYLPSKGFVQQSPFVNFTAMGGKGPVEPTIRYQYPGTQHNVNSPFEYSFQGLVANSPYLPDTDASNRGFIVTGYKISSGLSRCVIDELPGRPLRSLAQLQNWDARYENPIPPYCFNLVGNSDATPLIPADAVVNAAEASAKRKENLQHDDSYCLNHVLFDDWFVSSIAPDPNAFGNSSLSSNPRSVYAEFLKNGGTGLANRAYRAIPEDVGAAAVSTSAANSLASKNVGSASTSWKTIASRLEVEGMFNVNSTSVTAWRALLGHARNQQVPYMDGNGNPKLSSETDYAFSRFCVAGDVATSGKGSSGSISGAAEYSGYRVFEDKDLDFLAEEMVNQVRLRGPFLSLSEFVNRQLSSGELALAGAIQTALKKLSESPNNPFKTLQTNLSGSGTNTSTATPPGGVTGYKFAAAAVGYNIYGIPGWTRQADILRALAPVLSARDDTFTIRAYGEARDGTGKTILASTVCEATVRRSRQYVDQSDDAALATLSGGSGSVPALQPANARFGRRFEVVSFRWLAPNEI